MSNGALNDILESLERLLNIQKTISQKTNTDIKTVSEAVLKVRGYVSSNTNTILSVSERVDALEKKPNSQSDDAALTDILLSDLLKNPGASLKQDIANAITISLTDKENFETLLSNRAVAESIAENVLRDVKTEIAELKTKVENMSNAPVAKEASVDIQRIEMKEELNALKKKVDDMAIQPQTQQPVKKSKITIKKVAQQDSSTNVALRYLPNAYATYRQIGMHLGNAQNFKTFNQNVDNDFLVFLKENLVSYRSDLIEKGGLSDSEMEFVNVDWNNDTNVKYIFCMLFNNDYPECQDSPLKEIVAEEIGNYMQKVFSDFKFKIRNIEFEFKKNVHRRLTVYKQSFRPKRRIAEAGLETELHQNLDELQAVIAQNKEKKSKISEAAEMEITE